MLSVVGFAVVLLVVSLLLSQKVIPVVALTLVPLAGAFFAGFSLDDIAGFFENGLNKVMATAAMFIFAILYFGVMQSVGLFDPLINRVIRLSGGNVTAIAVGTVFVGVIAQLDGSGASTFLITLPALLPVYQRLKMSPYLLVLLVGASASIINMVPWGGPLARAATVIDADPAVLWQPLIPLQAVALVVLTLMAVFLGAREQRRIAAGVLCSALSESVSKETTVEEKHQISKRRYGFNVLLTSLLIASLMLGALPTPLSFMIALSIALLVNFPTVEQQAHQIKLHAHGALMMASIIIAAGVFLGILNGSGMLNAMAVEIVTFLPSATVPYLHLIVAFFGAPFELILSTDAYYFALLPVVEQIVSQHGVAAQSTAYAMLIGNIIGTFISPFSPALWLAIGLANIEMGRYIRYSLWWIWGLSLVLLLIARMMNIF